MNDNKLEILSPAGDLDTLIQAVNNGAGAVYLGGKKFGARKNATNFTLEEIKQGVEYAHLSGTKVYVTVNTIVFDDEIPEVVDFIREIYNIGVDAIIVQDIAVASLCRKFFPHLKLHASTQMTVHSSYGVKMCKELGFQRVVLSRELSEKEISDIVKENECETEVFVHGALCVCYSGQCLMSGIIGQRSGNRGECAQPCRLPYKFRDYDGKVAHEPCYLLSLKDLCLVKEIDRLKRCGVTSLKIEGRMKNREYVSYVTDMYHRANKGEEISDKDYENAELIFSRSGFTTGYFDDLKGRHMVNINANNDNVYRNIPEELLEKCRNLGEKKKKPVKAYIKAKIGEPLSLKIVYSDEIYGEYTLDQNIEVAKNALLSFDKLTASVSKLGDTFFYLEKLYADFDQDAFIPIKDINLARRECIEQINRQILDIDRPKSNVIYNYSVHKNKPSVPFVNVKVLNREQFNVCIKHSYVNKIFVDYEAFDKDRAYYLTHKQKLVVSLPVIVRDKFKSKINLCGVSDVAISNLGHLEFCKGKNIYGEEGLNIANSISCEEYKALGFNSVVLSPELNLGQISKITSDINKEVIAYGRLALMNSENCLIKTYNGKCGCDERKFFSVIDRKNTEFPVLAHRFNCTNTLYNSQPVYMADRLDEINRSGVDSLRLVFTLESADEVNNILSLYKEKKRAPFDYTRGHFYRGV